MRDADYFAIKERAAARLLRLPHVTAVGLGGREVASKATGEIAIKVFVERKLPLDTLAIEQRIPSSFEGVPTDVVESGPIQRAFGTTVIGFAETEPFFPLRGGVGVATENRSGTGTLGCILQDRRDSSAVYALTNHHVVTRQDKLSRTRRVAHPAERVGDTFEFNEDNTIGIVADGIDDATLDAAVVRLRHGQTWIPFVEEIGFLQGDHELTLDDVKNNDYRVRKRGTKTRLTDGVVACIAGECLELTTTVDKRVRQGNIFIRPNPADPDLPFNPFDTGQLFFSHEGDSGSVLVNDENEVVGLLYAFDSAAAGATPGHGIAFPIRSVLARLSKVAKLELEVATGPLDGDPNDEALWKKVPRPAGVTVVPFDEQAERGDHRHQRPLMGGLQILTKPMLLDAYAATLGCVVTKVSAPDEAYVLTSYGAISAEGTLAPTAFTDTGQPNNRGSSSGCCSNTVGEFAKGGPAQSSPHAALVKLGDDQPWLAEIVHIGAIRGTDEAVLSDQPYPVRKRGAGTGLTAGVISDLDEERMLIRPFSDPANPTADVRFSSFGDRGAAIVNDANKIVGVLYDELEVVEGGRRILHGVAAPIGSVLEAFKLHASIEVKVAATQQLDVVHKASARVALADDAIEARARVRSPARPGQPQQPLGLPDELLQSPAGERLAIAWRQHEPEVRRLIDHNRRVATVWHRSGGPALLQALMNAFHARDARLPRQLNGQPITACVERFAQALERYGSASLRSDLSQVRQVIPQLGGLSYADLIAALSAPAFEPQGS